MSKAFRIKSFCSMIILFSVSFQAILAQSMEGTRIIKVSESKKSIILDLGFAEGLRDGDRAKLFVKSLKQGLLAPKFSFVAEGELIKVQNNLSYWFLRKVKNYRYINEGNIVQIVRQAKDPRRPFISKRTLRVQGRAEDQKYYQVSEDKGVPDDLIFEEEDFFAAKELRDTSATKKQDFELTHKTRYVRGTREYDEQYQQEKSRLYVPGKKDDTKLVEAIKEKTRDSVFDSTTRNSVEKYNHYEYGLRSLYSDLEREGGIDIKSSSDHLSIREKQLLEDSRSKKVSQAAIDKIRTEGAQWSQSMNDEQLRAYLIKTGIEGELKRQHRVLAENPGKEITLRYTSNISRHTTDEDSSFQNSGYALSAAFEWHLAATSELMRPFTLEFEIERAISFYDVGGVNGRITEGSLKGYLNWYFWHPPTSLYRYMPYVGVGFKRGNGELESGQFDNIYQYQLVGLPSGHIGLKYRFKSGDGKKETLKVGFGLNLQLKYENVRYSVSEELLDDIYPSFSTSQTRLSVGFNIYF